MVCYCSYRLLREIGYWGQDQPKINTYIRQSLHCYGFPVFVCTCTCTGVLGTQIIVLLYLRYTYWVTLINKDDCHYRMLLALMSYWWLTCHYYQHHRTISQVHVQQVWNRCRIKKVCAARCSKHSERRVIFLESSFADTLKTVLW